MLCLEGVPEFGLGQPTLLLNRRETQNNGAVSEIGSRDSVCETVHDDRAAPAHQKFLTICIQPSRTESAPCRDLAQCVTDRLRDLTQVVEAKGICVIRRNEQIADSPGKCS